MKLINLLSISIFLVLISCTSNTSKKNKISKTETTDISTINFLEEYTLSHAEYGTNTVVTIKDGKRIMKSNAIPNHKTGTFPNPGNPNAISIQTVEYEFPVTPTLSGESKWARQPGVAINGVKFEPETAERFVCETGQVYKVEAFQDLLDLGLDFNNAHVQPTGAYHYHGVPTGLVEVLGGTEDLVLVGFAMDGFPMYYSKSGKYKSSFQLSDENRTGDACSYTRPGKTVDLDVNNSKPDGSFVSDWEYKEGSGSLDECNGTEINGSYCYLLTDEYPYVGRCLKGIFTEKGHPGRSGNRQGPHPNGEHRHDGRPPHQH